jgi:hypothetical protein
MRKASRKKTMAFLSVIRSLPVRVRRFVAPPYRPEKHYMRGYGPACAAREAARPTATL